MKFLSVCSGIDAASVAWKPLGFEAVAFSEIEPFPSAVLATRYPGVPNLGDMTRYKEWDLDSINILVGGTPCQSFSVAGLRRGMADPRGNLALVYLGIADKFRPQWIVWENVPGVLSSNRGRDFGSFLGALVQLGYGFAYRILDAKYTGVPQRRRRVFVVGHLGDWRRAAAVLFERESLCGVSPKGRSTKQEVAKTLRGRPNASHREDSDNCVALACTLSASDGGAGGGMHPVVAFSSKDHGQDIGHNQSPTLRSMTGAKANGGGQVAVAYQCQGSNVGPMGTLRAGNGNETGGVPFLAQRMAVRRLTPRECERLQGFPDDWTLIEYRGKPAADGPRYKAIGNSMAVPVMRWIGNRIKQVDDLMT